MLRTDLVPSRHLRNNFSRAIRLRDDSALLLLGPATPTANTSSDFNSATRPRIVNYIVDYICKPISLNRSTSGELSAPPQGAAKTPLSIFSQSRQLNFSRTCWITFQDFGMTSSVSVMSSPNLDSRAPPQQAQAAVPAQSPVPAADAPGTVRVTAACA
jgi:hypothetical protein